MKRSGFKRQAIERKPPVPPKPIPPEMRARVSMPMVGGTAQPAPKPAPLRSEAWRRAVASLACVQCGREGHTQAAHRNQGKGMGTKTDDICAALCASCHSEIDQGRDMTREQRRATLDAAIVDTVIELAKRGVIVVA